MRKFAVSAVLSAAMFTVLAPGARADTGVIDGTPLKIYADGVGRLQIVDKDLAAPPTEVGEFFPSGPSPAHAGLEIVEGASYFPLGSATLISGPTLTPGTPTTLTSTYKVGSDLEVKETIAYTDASRNVDLTYDIKNTSAAPVTFHAAELADLTTGGDDAGSSFLGTRHGVAIVGGWTPAGALVGLEQQTPWDRHEAGTYYQVFNHFAQGGLTGLTDPRYLDDGVGAEWSVPNLDAGATKTLKVSWRVGADEVVNTTADTADDGCTTAAGGCTLREALNHSGSGDIVTLPAGDYQLAQGHVAADHNLTVLGGNARSTAIHGAVNDITMSVGTGATLDMRATTITGGDAGDGNGGGINAGAGTTVQLKDSAVTGNHAWDGGGIYSTGKLELSRSLVSGNHVDHAGGGVALAGGSAAFDDSTFSGNGATQNGGAVYSTVDANLTNVTVFGNTAGLGGGVYEETAGQHITATNTIVAHNVGGSCRGAVDGVQLDYGVTDDVECTAAGGTGNQTVANAKLGPLTNNDGETDTYRPQPDSPAIDKGNPAAGSCPSLDQRALPRPTGVACDVGAVEANQSPGIIGVFTHVINDGGGHATAFDFVTHVLHNNVDATNPIEGDERGQFFELPGGVYRVAASPVAGYTLSYGGDCAANGAVTLTEGQEQDCTITANDTSQPQPHATLKVVTTVVNDDGGSKGPSDFSVRVRHGGADVAGSPKPGSAAGTTYTVAAGTYTVSAAAPAGYSAAIGGACAASGSITLAAGASKTCTVTGNDPVPPPVVHKSVNAAPAEGTVRIKEPGSNTFIELKKGASVPLGSVLDTRKGRVTLVAAANGSGGTATADFYDGLFKVGQTKGKKPITTLTLVETLSCKGANKAATIARKKKRRRRLWGDGHGRFRTNGSHSAATVVGTKWMVEDTCTTTTTKVARGRVKVRDFVKKKTVFVKAGHKYVARAR